MKSLMLENKLKNKFQKQLIYLMILISLMPLENILNINLYNSLKLVIKAQLLIMMLNKKHIPKLKMMIILKKKDNNNNNNNNKNHKKKNNKKNKLNNQNSNKSKTLLTLINFKINTLKFLLKKKS
jgi:hypothetical protein